MAEEREPTVGEVLEGKRRGEPVLSHMHDETVKRWAAERERLDKITSEFEEFSNAVMAEAAEARVQVEHERVAREQATLDAIQAIRDAASAAAEASEDRERTAAAREARMLQMTETLVKVTWGLGVLAALTLAATVLAVILAA